MDTLTLQLKAGNLRRRGQAVSALPKQTMPAVLITHNHAFANGLLHHSSSAICRDTKLSKLQGHTNLVANVFLNPHDVQKQKK